MRCIWCTGSLVWSGDSGDCWEGSCVTGCAECSTGTCWSCLYGNVMGENSLCSWQSCWVLNCNLCFVNTSICQACRNRFFLEFNRCTPCPSLPNCEQCKNRTSCAKCLYPYILVNGTCVEFCDPALYDMVSYYHDFFVMNAYMATSAPFTET